ncbi:hypothetical protein Tco_0193124 [Tanacetum coccineum]
MQTLITRIDGSIFSRIIIQRIPLRPLQNQERAEEMLRRKSMQYAADEDDSNTRAGPCNGDWLSKDLLVTPPDGALDDTSLEA